MDYGHRQTDKKLKQLERRLRAEYSQAYTEIKKKTDDYFKTFKVQDEKKLALLKSDKITKKEYQEWRTKKLATGKRWEELKGSIAVDLNNTDVIAREMINDNAIDVYVLNYNYGGYEVESAIHGYTAFTLYDRQTVLRLMKKNPTIIPAPGKRISEAIAEGRLARWNMQKVQSVMTQAIIQGESIPKIAERLANTVTVSNMKAAVRDARTMTTASENSGRLDSYRRARDIGINLKKVWVATEDGRTRPTHLDISGEAVPIEEPFLVGDSELMYPADPDGDASEVYNCRCTLIAEVDDEQEKGTDDISDMSFEEWEDSK